MLSLVLAAALLPIAGIFAAADAAITTASPARVDELVREGRRSADALSTILEDRPRYTNLLLLLRVSAELTATVLVAAVAFSTWGFLVSVALLVVAVMIVICYVVIGVAPRTVGRQHPYSIGLLAARPTRAIARVLSPVASLLIVLGNALTPGRGFREGPFTSDLELRELVDIAGSRGVVEETEREMLQSVFDLGDTIVREVMVPRTDVVWIEDGKSLRQAMQLANRSGFSRVPVVGEDLDDVLGVVHVKDMLDRALSMAPGEPGPLLRELMREPAFVPESKNIDVLLRDMQRTHNHFAVIVDEYGGTAGIATIEDLLEEIVGEITDEYDQDTPDPIEHLDGDRVRVSARLPVDELAELFDVDIDTEDVDTVGGLLAQQIGRVPLPGSEAEIAGLRLVGEPGTDRRGRPRVLSVLVERVPDEPERAPEEHSGDDPDESPVERERREKEQRDRDKKEREKREREKRERKERERKEREKAREKARRRAERRAERERQERAEESRPADDGPDAQPGRGESAG
ncbi:HlyC/CorC family transporter [Nakamurella flava]|uniref:HlyC/CorC family transporter n=1 Tax=Nakamurella flava TaxID=2576308 RepID=A0A4U6QQ76_9ACTN|nr:HlyC/CorC family transporter [Nakamurella flava]